MVVQLLQLAHQNAPPDMKAQRQQQPVVLQVESLRCQAVLQFLRAHFQLQCPLDTLQEIALLMVVQLLQVAHHNATLAVLPTM
jgi:hypothetical protein